MKYFWRNIGVKGAFLTNKWFILLYGSMLLLFSSCWDPDRESIHQLRIANNTNDTLVFSLVVRHLCPNCEVAAEDAWELFPNDDIHIATDVELSGFDLLNHYCGSYLDTAIIYKITDDTLNSKKILTLSGNYYYVSTLVRWGGPLLCLSDSIHSFYNESSWNFSKNSNSNKNKKIVATFTIRPEDLGIYSK